MMKRLDILLKVALGTAVLLAVLTFLDYLALHDIYKDYVSQAVLSSLNIRLSAELPVWTSTALEWSAVTVNYILKIGLALANILLVVIIKKAVQKSGPKILAHK